MSENEGSTLTKNSIQANVFCQVMPGRWTCFPVGGIFSDATTPLLNKGPGSLISWTHKISSRTEYIYLEIIVWSLLRNTEWKRQPRVPKPRLSSPSWVSDLAATCEQFNISSGVGRRQATPLILPGTTTCHLESWRKKTNKGGVTPFLKGVWIISSSWLVANKNIISSSPKPLSPSWLSHTW